MTSLASYFMMGRGTCITCFQAIQPPRASTTQRQSLSKEAFQEVLEEMIKHAS